MTTSSASSNPFSVLSEPEVQTGKLPPATPVYVLRGHASPIHALHFYSRNSRLISGDAEGWVVVWNMSTKRVVASWKAHESAVLGVEGVVISSDQDAEGKGEGSASERWVFTYVVHICPFCVPYIYVLYVSFLFKIETVYFKARF